MPEPEFPPLLQQGFHAMDVAGLRRLCVERFPLSLSRASIMDGLEGVLQRANASSLTMEAWVDGSFMTEKMNPRDSDVVFRVARSDWASASSTQKSVLLWVNGTDLKPTYKCDAYAFVDDATGPSLDDSEWDRSHWIRQFGFSRGDVPRGVAVINLPYLIT